MCIACGGCHPDTHQRRDAMCSRDSRLTRHLFCHCNVRKPSFVALPVRIIHSILPWPPPLLLCMCPSSHLFIIDQLPFAYSITIINRCPLRLLPSVSPCGKHGTLSPTKLAARHHLLYYYSSSIGY